MAGDTGSSLTSPINNSADSEFKSVSLTQDINNKVHDPIDANAVLIVRGTIFGLGILGLAKVARSIRLFTQFRHASSIPNEFVQRSYRLPGQLVEVQKDGDLLIRHSPTLRLPLSSRKKSYQDELDRSKDCLHVRLAAINLTDNGQKYIYKTFGSLKYEPRVWFTLLQRHNETIDCDVLVKKFRYLPLSTYSINTHLVRRGLARVPSAADEAHSFAMKTQPAYAKLVDQLVIAEQIADRRGVGVWRRRTIYEAIMRYGPKVVDGVKNSTLYLASRMTADSLRQLVNSARTVGNRVATTGNVLATDVVPRAGRAILDAGYRNQDTIEKVGRGAGQATYFVARILYSVLNITMRFFMAIFRIARGSKNAVKE